MKEKISIHSFSNYFILLIMVFLIPMQEWPDNNEYWNINQIYSNALAAVIYIYGITPPSFESSLNHSFFSDSFMFLSQWSDHLINLSKLILIIPSLYILNILSTSVVNRPLPFAPPFIFSILSVSLEPIAIILITASYLLLLSRRIMLALFIAFIATLIDRSMAVTLSGIIIYAAYIQFRIKLRYIFLIIFIFILLALSPSIIFFENTFYDILNFYGISKQEIVYNNQFGKNNILALIASLSGLYGWMSIRPTPWILYYTVIILLFIFGFIKADHEKKIEFLFFLIPTLAVLYILPPLSQARYFPILTLLYWETLLTGAKYLFGRVDILVFSVIGMTSIGLLLAHFK